MDNTADIRIGDRLRLTAAHFPRGYEYATVVNDRGQSIYTVRFDDQTDALLHHPIGKWSLVRVGMCRLIDIVERVEVTPATDLEDEDDIQAVA